MCVCVCVCVCVCILSIFLSKCDPRMRIRLLLVQHWVKFFKLPLRTPGSVRVLHNLVGILH